MKNNVLNRLFTLIILISLPLLALVFFGSSSPDSTIHSWPGASEVSTFDLMFEEDSSGLDFYDNQLYAVDNGESLIWILDVKEDGTLHPAPGYEYGKHILFPNGINKPDSEGITVDSQKNIYIASESGPVDTIDSHNYVLQVTYDSEISDVTADKVWDLNSTLPASQYNKGIEAIEWVSFADVKGKFYDMNTNKPFDSKNYPDAVASGVFFVSLEANGHVYAYVLNADGSSVQLADFDPYLGGAMALDYDTDSKLLWIITDNNFNNKSAVLCFNGSDTPDIAYVNAPAGVDVTHNHEGFAIGAHSGDAVQVYRFCDGEETRALSMGYLDLQYGNTIF